MIRAVQSTSSHELTHKITSFCLGFYNVHFFLFRAVVELLGERGDQNLQIQSAPANSLWFQRKYQHQLLTAAQRPLRPPMGARSWPVGPQRDRTRPIVSKRQAFRSFDFETADTLSAQEFRSFNFEMFPKRTVNRDTKPRNGPWTATRLGNGTP